MKKPAIIMFVLISILLLSGCAIRTPQINGLVLDEETKQPVPEAWVTSMITINYATVAGNVSQYISVDPPHTRTDKDGKFVIPSRKIKGATFPFEFGNDVKHFGVDASTADDRGGSISLKEALGKNKVDIIIFIKPEFTNSTESEHFSALQALDNYCTTGRFAVEVPAVEGGCDAWELDYAIKKHERFLERYILTDKTRSHRSIILEQLGLLYEKKRNYEKAIEYLTKAKEIRFFLPQSLEYKISELKKILDQNPK
jgi:hypothetical protein